MSSADGTAFPALAVFPERIKYLVLHLLKHLEIEFGIRIDSKMVQWVLTGPAIWRDESKSFMREAIYKVFKDKLSSMLNDPIETYRY